MDKNALPVRATVEVKADATEALNRSVEKIGSGLGRVISSIFGKREANVAAYARVRTQQAEIDAELIKYGLAVVDSETETVKRLCDPEKIALFLLSMRQERAPKNVAACFHNTALALEESGQDKSQDHEIDPDFLDAWLDGAQKVNSEYLQRVWGKILALNIRQENAISIRTVLSLAQVSQQEAELFRRFLRYRVNDIIVIPSQHDDNICPYKYEDVLSLIDTKFLIPENFMGLQFEKMEDGDLYLLRGSGAVIKIDVLQPVDPFSISGRALSRMGVEVAKIAMPDPIDVEVLEYFYRVIRKGYPNLVKKISAHQLTEEGNFNLKEESFSYTPPVK